jgi:hypothetical protein
LVRPGNDQVTIKVLRILDNYESVKELTNNLAIQTAIQRILVHPVNEYLDGAGKRVRLFVLQFPVNVSDS